MCAGSIPAGGISNLESGVTYAAPRLLVQGSDCSAPSNRGQDMHFSPDRNLLVEGKGLFPVDRQEHFRAQADSVDDSPCQRRILTLKVCDDCAQRCAGGFERVFPTHQRA